MQREPNDDQSGSGFLPHAGRHALGVALMIALTWTVIAETRHGGEPVDAMPPSVWPFVVWSLAALVALGFGAVLADRSWRIAGGRSLHVAPGDITDPWIALLAPYRCEDSRAEARLRVEQVGHIFRQLDVMMAINVLNALLVAAAIWATANSWLLGGWLAIVGAGAVATVRSRMSSARRGLPRAVSKRALRRVSLHSGLRGLAWGAAFALFFVDAGLVGKLILGSVSVGMLAGGVLALAPIPSAALLYGLGVMAPTILRLVSLDANGYAILALFGVTYTASMMLVAYQLYHNFASNHVARQAEAEGAATISMLLNEFETSASDWLFETDEHDRLTRLPDRFAELTGARPGADGALPRLSDLVSPAVAGRSTGLAEAMAERRPFREIVVRTIGRDRETRWLALSGSPKPDGGYRGVGSDITARVHADEQRQLAFERAERAEQRLKDAISSIGSGFVLTAPDGRVLLANRSFYELFPSAAAPNRAVTLAETLGTSDGHGDEGWRDLLVGRRGDDGAPVDIELPTNRWVRVRRSPTTEGGTVILFTDVTDIKQQEAMLASQARRLRASNHELEQFATVASHDLQEPLRKIEAFGGRLGRRMQGKLDEESAYFLERMMVATQRMRSLITDLLAYSRVGRRDEAIREIDLDRLAAGVVDDLAVAIQEKQAIVRIAPLGQMQGDQTQLRQLFQNILSNALKFASPGRTPEIEVARLARPDGGHDITFRDNGIGFDMKHHDTIFELFQRLHGRDQYEGTGIGLATCRKIVERHGGLLTARSAPGLGSTFVAAFPGAIAVEGGTDAASATKAA